MLWLCSKSVNFVDVNNLVESEEILLLFYCSSQDYVGPRQHF
jgi:hypothetical protein